MNQEIPHIRLADFDLEKFLLGKRIDLDSDETKILKNACDHLAKERERICLIAPPGTGVENVWIRYKEENPEQIYVVSCKNGDISFTFGDLMLQLGFGHKLVNWYSTPVTNIIEGLVYFLNKKNNRTLLVFDNCDSLKIPMLCNLLSFLLTLKNQTGIIYRVTPDYAERLKKSSVSQIRHYVTQFDNLEIKYSEPFALLQAVQNNGIISKAVAENLIKKTFDFDVICNRVDVLRQEVKAFIAKRDDES